ncbi:Copialike retrotransposable element [Phytophthora palmivora]|uniref:Copialike retrotransposable element n=1 Tax=Phytophthora palmivora TaxID=4796 RepID=A0A2P4XGB4_9STRA|nr:Copialike retrotransposable element [Phytophthora palmivora]
MGKLVVFGSPCKVYRDPRNMHFSHRALEGLIIGISEETKGYRVYLPKSRVVATTQQESESDAETVGNVDAGTASGRVKKEKERTKKKSWQRD